MRTIAGWRLSFSALCPAARSPTCRLASMLPACRWAFRSLAAAVLKVGAAALANMTKFSLELGGKNPLIVLSDVDTQSLLPGLMMGCFMN